MAIVGCLGSVVFTVSCSTVRTLNKLVWSGSARYAVHQRHLGTALTEFTGLDPQKITFDMILITELGVDPMSEAQHIDALMSIGAVLPLVIGSRWYGRGCWTITNFSMKEQAFSPGGDVSAATVSVSLQEYGGW